MVTKAQADKNSQKAIDNARKGIARLEKQRDKHSGRELRDIDEQLAQLRHTIAKHEQAMRG